MTYIPRLDTFRAVAALLIVHFHYFRDLLPPALQIDTSWGVTLFFVLSGFLITGTLLDAANQPPAQAIARFYVRRTFRIFPLYYAVLLIGLALGLFGFRQSLPWSALYLSNVAWMLGIDQGYASHLWTLAIEEQFYLLWPLAVLFTRRPALIAAAAIAAAVMYRAILAPDTDAAVTLMLNLLGLGDALALGALGALACQRLGAAKIELILRPLLLISVPMLVVFAIKSFFPLLPPPVLLTVFYPIAGLGFLWLIVRAERDGPHASSWGGRVMPAIGRISYGIYLWHFPMLALGAELQRRGITPALARGTCVIATLGVSALFYRILEQPLRRLGRRLASRITYSDRPLASSIPRSAS